VSLSNGPRLWPVVIASEVAVFAAGVAEFTLTVPAGATAIQTARSLNMTTLQLEQTVSASVFFSEALLPQVFDQPIISLDPTATLTRLIRAPSVIAFNALVKYLR